MGFHKRYMRGIPRSQRGYHRVQKENYGYERRKNLKDFRGMKV